MSARGGKFFRPGKFLRSEHHDDVESSEDEDDSEDEEKPQTKNASANLSSDDDDDELEDEDDDDDDDVAETNSSKRKATSAEGGTKKRPKTSAFFDEEAEASGSEDDDDDGEAYGTHHDPDDVVRKHYTDEDIRREQLDDEARELIKQQDRRRQQAGQFGSGEKSVAQMARDIEERHKMQRRMVPTSHLDRVEEEGPVEANYSAVSQQSLVPSVSDPSLWMVSCLPGKEQDLIYQVMNKCTAFARRGQPLGITSAVASSTKGKVYVESYSEPAVLEAIQGVRGLLQYSMTLVPINDMTTVMTVTPKKKPVKINEWVRMTRGHYKGDLALVKAVRESGLKCVIQCVPRLDLILSDLPPEEARIRRRTVRPPQKFFNTAELAALGKHPVRQRFPGMDFCDYFEGNYFEDGYMIKEVTVGSMIKPCTDEDPPTLDELQRFRRRQKGRGDNQDDDDGDENEGSKMAASLLDELSELQGKTGLAKTTPGGGLIIGDTIEVIEGDLVGMRGKLVSLDSNGSTVKVKPTNNSVDLGDTTEVEFLTSQVRKYIPVGVHVKVTDGRYANETGVVVAVEPLEGESDCTAVVLTDVTHKEISVRTSQLRESAEVASGQDKLAGYELHDLVVLSGGGSANETGVIVRVGREDFTVINNHGIVREVRPEELRGKRNQSSNRAVALDVQGNQIRCGDSVNVAEGPHKGKTATIKRMSRSQLFLYSQTRTEHAGIFVVRSRSCVLAGNKSQNRGGAGDGGVSPFATPRSQSGGAGPVGGRGKRDDALIGKTVRIQAGQWKGYLGAVSDATATHVQVELHSRLKKVMVVRERVAVVGDKFGATEDTSRNAPAANAAANTTTPFIGGATPMHGGATPMYGGATPMHDGMSGGDDVWRPGTMDDNPVGEESMDNSAADGGWGSSTTGTTQDFPFGGSSTGADSGWSSNAQSGSTWAPTTTESEKKEENGDQTSTAAQDTAVSGAGTQIKRETTDMEAEDMGDADETAVWFMERVCVQLKNENAAAVIKEINSDKTAVVEMEADKSTKVVRVGEVSMVPPKEHDMVLVTGGADVGVEGELVCVDGTDAILKDASEEFKIVDFVHLAKIVSDA